ncbi:hypothetical protein B0H14DRAFT_3476818 [Mycena olivaceomarginata]|nr:hypothetical protein B0H14DRAFT_3476818 [Mycena olivaceomarginata]
MDGKTYTSRQALQAHTHTFTRPPLASGTSQHAQGPGRWDKTSGNCEIYFAREHGGELSTTEKKRKGGVVPASHVADKERRGERIPSAASMSMYHVRRAAHRSPSSPATGCSVHAGRVLWLKESSDTASLLVSIAFHLHSTRDSSLAAPANASDDSHLGPGKWYSYSHAPDLPAALPPVSSICASILAAHQRQPDFQHSVSLAVQLPPPFARMFSNGYAVWPKRACTHSGMPGKDTPRVLRLLSMRLLHDANTDHYLRWYGQAAPPQLMVSGFQL